MTRKLTKTVLGLAVTAAIGAGAIGVNGFLTFAALAADANPTVPNITADVAASNENTNVQSSTNHAAVIKVDDSGKQTIVFDKSLTEEQKLELQRDLERVRTDLNGGIDAGETNPVFVAGTPSEEDLTEEAAIKAAKEAIVKDYALTDETLSKFSTHATFNVVDPEAPVWSITFYPTNQNDFSQIGNYNITIDSLSGKIIKILSAADGVG